MQNHLPPSLERLVQELGKWPGIGRKTALRLGMHVLGRGPDELKELAAVLESVAVNCRFCERCANVSEEELCSICRDKSRDESTVCVVEQLGDLMALERSGEFRGVYHILGGALSPLDGIMPDQLRIAELEHRVQQGAVRELILALNTTVEGDATTLYLQRRFASTENLRLSRLAQGLPMGGNLDYLDQLTISRALDRREALDKG